MPDKDPEASADEAAVEAIAAASEPEIEEVFVPDDPEKVEAAERMLREANLARVRGNATVADRILKEASETAPNTPSVLVALGDDLVARGQFRKAKELFGRAHKIDPSDAAAENKYAEMVLKVDLRIDPFAHAEEFSGYANGKVATILSLICPGLGQFAVERYTKGWIMIGAYALSWIGNWLMPGGLRALVLFSQGKGPMELPGFVFLAISIGIILWSIFDLTSLKRHPVTPRETPTPPSEWLNR